MLSLAPFSSFTSPLISRRSVPTTLALALFSFPIPKSRLTLNSGRSASFPSATRRDRQQEEILSPSDPSDDEEEQEDDDDDEEDEAAEAAAAEYDEALLPVEDEDEDEGLGETETSTRVELKEGEKWQRIERLLALVRELGEGIIDFEELAGIYDFPIDKFQVLILPFFDFIWKCML